MEGTAPNSDTYGDRSSSTNSASSRRYRVQLSASNLIRSPISTLLEYSGLLRPRSGNHESESLLNGSSSHIHVSSPSSNGGEVSIRIIGSTEPDHDRAESSLPANSNGVQLQPCPTEPSVHPNPVTLSSSASSGSLDGRENPTNDGVSGDGVSQFSSSGSGSGSDADGAAGANSRDTTYQRYDIQQAARWIEQVLPFSLLLLVVFIRQHLQGFFVTIWIAVVMFKSNDILRKQTALKGERKMPVLIGISILFALHVAGVYWWYRNDDLLYPLLMLPPKVIPPFWHAVFIILVNGSSYQSSRQLPVTSYQLPESSRRKEQGRSSINLLFH